MFGFRCGECDKVFPSDETLTEHRQMVHQNNSSLLQVNQKLTEGSESGKKIIFIYILHVDILSR